MSKYFGPDKTSKPILTKFPRQVSPDKTSILTKCLLTKLKSKNQIRLREGVKEYFLEIFPKYEEGGVWDP